MTRENITIIVACKYIFVDLAHALQTEQANAFNSHLYNEHINVLQTKAKRLWQPVKTYTYTYVYQQHMLLSFWLVATSEA